MAEKNPVDHLFDVAESLLGGAERMAAPAQGLQDDPDTEVQERWEKSFEETKWAPVSDSTWHAFAKFGRTLCGLTVDMSQIGGLRTLEHGRAIPACTSCIIGVSR